LPQIFFEVFWYNKHIMQTKDDNKRKKVADSFFSQRGKYFSLTRAQKLFNLRLPLALQEKGRGKSKLPSSYV